MCSKGRSRSPRARCSPFGSASARRGARRARRESWSRTKRCIWAVGSMRTMLQRQTGEWRSVGDVECRRTAQKAVNTFRMSDDCFAPTNGWTRRHELGTLTAQGTYAGAENSPGVMPHPNTTPDRSWGRGAGTRLTGDAPSIGANLARRLSALCAARRIRSILSDSGRRNGSTELSDPPDMGPRLDDGDGVDLDQQLG